MHCAWPVSFWKNPVVHASQLPAPASALDVPTPHAMHTPALAPPQPLRASPALPQPPHGVQLEAPTTLLNVALGHASQCDAALVRGSAAPALPRLPAAHASQLVEPAAAWYWPSWHALQFGALVAALKRPAVHGAQPRSTMAVGAVNTFVPAEQLRQVVQMRGAVAEPADTSRPTGWCGSKQGRGLAY